MNKKALDIKSKEFTNYLVSTSKLSANSGEDLKRLKVELSSLKNIKDAFSRAYSKEERESIDNWSYLLFTIDTLKDTINKYEKERISNMENWEIERDRKQERVKVIKNLKAKYEGKDLKYNTLQKIIKDNNLNALEVEYIFFEDALLSRLVRA